MARKYGDDSEWFPCEALNCDNEERFDNVRDQEEPKYCQSCNKEIKAEHDAIERENKMLADAKRMGWSYGLEN